MKISFEDPLFRDLKVREVLQAWLVVEGIDKVGYVQEVEEIDSKTVLVTFCADAEGNPTRDVDAIHITGGMYPRARSEAEVAAGPLEREPYEVHTAERKFTVSRSLSSVVQAVTKR